MTPRQRRTFLIASLASLMASTSLLLRDCNRREAMHRMYGGGEETGAELNREQLIPDPPDVPEEVRQLGFDATIVQVAGMVGDSLHQYRTAGPEDSLVPQRTLEVDVTEGPLAERLELARTLVKPLGYQAFVSEQEPEGEHDRIAIIEGGDQLDILRTTGAGSGPGGPGTDALIAAVADWSLRYGLQIDGAGRDWVDLTFEKRPGNAPGFPEALQSIAPDAMVKPAISASDRDRQYMLRWSAPAESKKRRKSH